MTEKTELAKTFEKSWRRSKKFIAFLIMECLLYSLALITLLTQDDIGWSLAAFMFGLVVSMGAMALAFNGRQAQLDAYVRGMAMVGRVSSGVRDEAISKIGVVDRFSGIGSTDEYDDFENNCVLGGENGEA